MPVWYWKDMMSKYLQPTGVGTAIWQLTLPLALALGLHSGADWEWWAASLFMWIIVYGMVGNNLAMHRYLTHGQFEVSNPVKYMFVWLGTMIGVGSPVSYAATHLVHHKYPDTEHDPHGPGRGLRSVLMCFQKTVDLRESKVFSKRMVTLIKEYAWMDQYYVLWFLANAVILYSIDYKLFLFLWWIPANITAWGIGWTVWVQHWGHKPTNGYFARWTPVFESYHANHHIDPQNPNTAINPGEVDWTYRLCKLFRPKYKHYE
jgi:stearoyl-CoA desaturase (delta-9 desaturase)